MAASDINFAPLSVDDLAILHGRVAEVGEGRVRVELPDGKSIVVQNPERLEKLAGTSIADATTTAIAGAERAIRTGTITVALLELSKVVTFSSPMPDTNYRVALTPTSALNVGLAATAKTVDGFTLTVSLSVSGTIDYIVVADA